MKQATQYEKARLTAGSTGSAFAAPNYPSHKYSVETDLNRRKENRGSMNIDYALTVGYISPALKQQITDKIKEWNNNKPAIGSEVFNKWVDECIRHWGSLVNALPHIHKFYPDYN